MLSGNRLIKIVGKCLLLLGCVFGGVVSAVVLSGIVAACIFDLRDVDRVIEYFRLAYPIACGVGATAGVIIFFRSEHSLKQTPKR